MPFAGYVDWEACIRAQKKKGYSDERSQKICGFLKHKFENSELGVLVELMKKE